MTERTVTVFGATGFLGRVIVARLLEAGMTVRVTARGSERVRFDPAQGRVLPTIADVREPAAVAAAVEKAHAVVNAVGLYVEAGAESFDAVHVRGAASVAEQSARAGATKLIHVSGIGADAASPSRYVRARAEGERIVKKSFPDAVILRPSVLFGPGDALLNTIDAITRWSPVFPLFGRGSTRLQPVFVGDVAEAVFRLIVGDTHTGRVCELGGPRVLSYRQVVAMVLKFRRRRRLLLPVPFAFWRAQARALSLLPSPPLTEDQVILMRDDNVVGEGVASLADLGVSGADLESLMPQCLPSPSP